MEILRRACAQMADWGREGIAPGRLSVNLSAHQLMQPHLVGGIVRVLADTGLAAECLELEITETALMQDVSTAQRVLRELRSKGLRVAIDDFGTGYSSLGYLKRFAIDTLKIDRSFIAHVDSDDDDVAIIAAIVELARRLKLQVVAEGVETLEQSRRLRDLGCDLLQGYHYQRPTAALDLRPLLLGGREAA